MKGKLSFWDYPGIKEVKIECPECGSIEIAIEDYTTAPFPTYLHRCNKCEHVIIKGRFRVKQTEEGRYYAVRIMKHTDEKGALKIYEKQIKEREHRRRRRQAEKLSEQK